MAAETMNQTPNLLIQLGGALGSGGALVVLLFICGGSVWVVMAVRRNKDDHDQLRASIETLRKENREDSKEIRAKIDDSRKESQEDSKEIRAKIDDSRKENREDLRAINSRLDQLIDRKPPDRPG